MHKSTRKSLKPRTTGLNAGTKERIVYQCPPNMTKKMRDAFLEEIKNFDAKQAQLAQEEAEKSAAGGCTLDAYTEWLEQHGGQEPLEANPDIVSEDNGLHYITSRKDDHVTRLLKEFRQLLSARELQVWNLVMAHQLSISEAADLLVIGKSTVQSYLGTAKAKFIKYMEANK